MKWLAALLILAACGGGGSSPAVGPVQQVPTLRPDLLFGYYAGAEYALEQQDHVNLYMTRPWGSGGVVWLAEVLGQLQVARAGGARVLLGLPGAYEPNAETELVAAWKRIREAGFADTVVALYPIDEPDVAGKSDAEVTAVNAMLKRVFDKPLAVIYGCATGRRPGWASYDWLGCDDYGVGCDNATGGTLWAFASGLAPHQRLILVPGGADPWRQDPACFAFKAHTDPRVVLLMPFLWQDHAADGVGRGIRSNGLRKAYCEAGRAIRGERVETCGGSS